MPRLPFGLPRLPCPQIDKTFYVTLMLLVSCPDCPFTLFTPLKASDWYLIWKRKFKCNNKSYILQYRPNWLCLFAFDVWAAYVLKEGQPWLSRLLLCNRGLGYFPMHSGASASGTRSWRVRFVYFNRTSYVGSTSRQHRKTAFPTISAWPEGKCH